MQVGSSCSGKGSMVRCLASLCGQKLLEFPMNSETDTIDLLGGFQQAKSSRSDGGRGQFEWVDSVLVKALERGHWLMISHANFCRYVI